MIKKQAILCPGDIVLKHNDHAIHNDITAFGQMFGKGPSHIVHAAIAISPREYIEMDGESVVIGRIKATEKYDVFRCAHPNIANEAMRFANDMMNNHDIRYGGFGWKGGVWSIWTRTAKHSGDINKRIERKITTSKFSLYCSSFVALCFQRAIKTCSDKGMHIDFDMRNTFSLEHHCYNPAYLWRRLDKSRGFKPVGTVRNGVLA